LNKHKNNLLTGLHTLVVKVELAGMNTLSIEKAGQLKLIRLNRGKANAINQEMVHELHESFWQLQNDQTCKGVLLTGRENFFSAGLDVVELYRYSEDELLNFWRSFSALIRLMVGFPKPLISAINGHSPAGGCVLALCCDERIMAEGPFLIGLNEIQVGIVVPQPIFELYRFWLGDGLAYQMLLEGRMVDAHTARQIGLVSAASTQDQIETHALQRLEALAAFQPEVWSLSKQALRRQLLEQLNQDFEAAFGPAIKQWWQPESRAIMEGLITKLKK
jgi:enoyl-CoA hydratase/carnithine racemase